MADAEGLNPSGREVVRVRVPPRAPTLTSSSTSPSFALLTADEVGSRARRGVEGTGTCLHRDRWRARSRRQRHSILPPPGRGERPAADPTPRPPPHVRHHGAASRRVTVAALTW